MKMEAFEGFETQRRVLIGTEAFRRRERERGGWMEREEQNTEIFGNEYPHSEGEGNKRAKNERRGQRSWKKIR